MVNGTILSIKPDQHPRTGSYDIVVQAGVPFFFGRDNSRNIAITVTDDVPPTITSAFYGSDGRLTLAFSEPLNATINYGSMHIRDTGMASGGISLDAISTKSHTGDTIVLALDVTQQGTVSAMTTPQLDIDSNAAFDMSGNGIAAAADHLIGTPLSTPPAFLSAKYTTGNGTLTITFDKDIDSAINYDSMHIRDTGMASGGISLDAISTKSHTGDTIILTLNGTQQDTVSAMTTPQLDIDADAVSDTTNNGIVAAADRPIAIVDTILPTLVSAAYASGTLTMTFSEPLNTTINYDSMHIRDTGMASGGISLDAISTRSHSGDTIILALDETQQGLVSAMTTPQLDVDSNAVFDMSGNGIAAAADQAVTISDTSPTAFITTWNIPTADYKLYISGSHTTTFTIDWGDGSISQGVSDTVSHTYTSPGNYTVSITGELGTFGTFFSDEYLISLDQWGSISWTDMNSIFDSMANMKYNATDVPDLKPCYRHAEHVSRRRHVQRKHLQLGCLIGYQHARRVLGRHLLQRRCLRMGRVIGHRHGSYVPGRHLLQPTPRLLETSRR